MPAFAGMTSNCCRLTVKLTSSRGRSAFGSDQPDRSPARPWIGAHGPAADDGRPVHVPDRDLAARALKQDVRMAGAIEVAGPDRMPARTWIGAHRPAAGDGGAVHLPDR